MVIHADKNEKTLQSVFIKRNKNKRSRRVFRAVRTNLLCLRDGVRTYARRSDDSFILRYIGNTVENLFKREAESVPIRLCRGGYRGNNSSWDFGRTRRGVTK